MTTIERPDASEHAPYYSRYIDLVPSRDLVEFLEEQGKATAELFRSFGESKADYRYAPDKWSLKGVLGHMIDTERVFSFRLLWLARGDTSPLPGFEQDDWMIQANFDSRSLTDLIEEFICVRTSTIQMIMRLPDSSWMNSGIISENPITVRALAYIIAGHELHHRKIVVQRYQK